jgi:hypothetical protein
LTVDKEAVKDARVTFVPDADKGNKVSVSPFGVVKDGNYTLTTKDKPGAPAGWYKVIVLTKYPWAPENAPVLPRIYADAAKSTLSVEVVANPQPGAYDLNLRIKNK